MVTIFYDSLCLVCNAEISFLRKVDKSGQISFIDITQPDFKPETYGKTLDDFIGSIHGIDSEGHLVNGMEVFRMTYAAAGLAWLLNWTAWPLIKPLADIGYQSFARVRPFFSRFKGEQAACPDNRCRIPKAKGP